MNLGVNEKFKKFMTDILWYFLKTLDFKILQFLGVGESSGLQDAKLAVK